MKRFLFLFFFLGPISHPSLVSAQATPTATPDCCQFAQTITGGTGGNFYILGNLSVNNSGTTLCVADNMNNQVQKFLLPGLVPAGVISGLLQPESLAMGGDGFLYVGNYGGYQVNKIDLTSGAVTATMATAGPVMGVVVDSNGDVYASIEDPLVKILVFPFTPPNSYGIPVTLNLYPSASPRGLLKRGNKLFVSDYDNHQILELDQSGPATAYNFSLPQTVVDITYLSYPDQIAMDSLNNLYVACTGNGEVVVLNGNLSPAPSVFSFHHQCSNGSMSPHGVAVDGMGTIYEGANDVFGAGPWEVLKIGPCPLFNFPTPTPSYNGANPPDQGNCFIYPSPARGDQATLSYNMAESGAMELSLWNQNGELSAKITDQKPPGVQITTFAISGLSSGVYFYSVALNYDSGKHARMKTKKFAVIH